MRNTTSKEGIDFDSKISVISFFKKLNQSRSHTNLHNLRTDRCNTTPRICLRAHVYNPSIERPCNTRSNLLGRVEKNTLLVVVSPPRFTIKVCCLLNWPWAACVSSDIRHSEISDIIAKPRIRLTTTITFSRQNNASLRARTISDEKISSSQSFLFENMKVPSLTLKTVLTQTKKRTKFLYFPTYNKIYATWSYIMFGCVALGIPSKQWITSSFQTLFTCFPPTDVENSCTR